MSSVYWQPRTKLIWAITSKIALTSQVSKHRRQRFSPPVQPCSHRLIAGWYCDWYTSCRLFTNLYGFSRYYIFIKQALRRLNLYLVNYLCSMNFYQFQFSNFKINLLYILLILYHTPHFLTLVIVVTIFYRLMNIVVLRKLLQKDFAFLYKYTIINNFI